MTQTPCTYRQLGDRLDYAPSGALTAGDVIAIGTTLIGIVETDYTTEDYAASKKAALGVRGVWNVPKDNSDVSEGDALYWDADGSPVGGTALSGAFTKTASGNIFAGVALEDAGTSVGDCDMFLRSIDGTVPGNLAPVPTGTVAATNSAINNGTPITSLGLTLVTGGNNTAAVVLPDAAAGSVLWLSNFSGGNNTIAVFPTVGDAINLLGANNVYTQATNTTIGFVKYNASQWYTF